MPGPNFSRLCRRAERQLPLLGLRRRRGEVGTRGDRGPHAEIAGLPILLASERFFLLGRVDAAGLETTRRDATAAGLLEELHRARCVPDGAAARPVTFPETSTAAGPAIGTRVAE